MKIAKTSIEVWDVIEEGDHIIYFDDGNITQEEAGQLLCKCGHKLYMHSFTLNYSHTRELWYYRCSQCILCTDYENQKFNCERFQRAE